MGADPSHNAVNLQGGGDAPLHSAGPSRREHGTQKAAFQQNPNATRGSGTAATQITTLASIGTLFRN